MRATASRCGSRPCRRTKPCRSAAARSPSVNAPARWSSIRPAPRSPAIASISSTCERVRMSTPGAVPPSSRRRWRVRCRRVPRSVWSEPVCTIRKHPVAGAGRRRAGEVVPVEPDRDAGDRPIGQVGQRATDGGGGLRRRGHDRRGAGQRPAHRAQVEGALDRRRVQAHLVERPRVLEVGDPRHAELGGEPRAGQRRLVRSAGREHDVRPGSHTPPERHGLLDPPAHPAVRARAQEREPRRHAGRPRRLGARDAVDLGVGGHAGEQLGILRIPAPAPHPGPRHEHRMPAAIRQVAHRSRGAMDARPAQGREAAREQQHTGHRVIVRGTPEPESTDPRSASPPWPFARADRPRPK